MIEMTVTEFAKKLKSVIDIIEFKGEEIVLLRNKHRIARIIPGNPNLTALEVLSDLYGTLTETAGVNWVSDSRIPDTINGLGDVWE